MANDKNVKKEKKRFFKDFKAELKKVTWPTGKQVVNNTVAVLTIVIITALIVFVLDLCFEKINTFGINKIKEATKNTQTTVVENNESTANDSQADVPTSDEDKAALDDSATAVENSDTTTESTSNESTAE